MSILIENVLSRLDKVKRQGRGYMACCPAHHEKTPSLSIKESGGKILMHCFGCHADIQELVSAMGLEMSDLFEESLNEVSRLRTELHRINSDINSLDGKLLVYQVALEKGELTVKDKIKYVEHIENRRQMILRAKKIKQELLEA